MNIIFAILSFNLIYQCPFCSIHCYNICSIANTPLVSGKRLEEILSLTYVDYREWDVTFRNRKGVI